jgi:hypothetical protein
MDLTLVVNNQNIIFEIMTLTYYRTGFRKEYYKEEGGKAPLGPSVVHLENTTLIIL